MYTICGIHDKPCDESPIYGTVRSVTEEECRRRFDVDGFISRYSKKKPKSQSILNFSFVEPEPKKQKTK